MRKNSLQKYPISPQPEPKSMKRIIYLLFVLVFTTATVYSQPARLSFRLMQLMQTESNGNQMISVLVKGNVPALREKILLNGGTAKNSSGDILSAVIPVSTLRMLAEDEDVIRMEEGAIRLEALNDRMLQNNRIDLVHAGVSPLVQGYDGSGVIMGIIDTGIDFTHPDFQDSTGQTRILWIWDHNLGVSVSTPAPYGYGQEFSAANINSGNAADHVDQTAHGTHVAGIAAGNGFSDSIFRGAAPAADIIAVSLNFSKNDEDWLSSCADAVDYIFRKADSLGQPCVINISAGTYFGSHDGKDLQAQYIDNLITAQSGRSVVAAAGNAGNYPLHIQHQPSGDTLFSWFREYSATGIYIELWGDTAGMNSMKFSIGGDMNSPGVADRGQMPYTTLAANNGIFTTDTLFGYSGYRLAIVQRYGQVVGNRYSMVFYIIPDSAGYWFRLMSTGNSKLDVWSFDLVTAGLPTVATYPLMSKFQMPDFNQTICSSFQCSDKVITVGQYVNRNNYIDVNNNLVTFATTEGALAASSSRGPTRDGRIKPDITSTGEVTLSCLKLSSQAWFLANQPFKLAQGGMHIRDGGTSSAAPAVAGIVALYLQKQPNADWLAIKNRVMYCSVQDAFTGSNLPDNLWGHGKADALSVMTGCNAIGIEKENEQLNFSIAPNPANTEITINFQRAGHRQLSLTDLSGRLLQTFEAIGIITQLNVGRYAAGIYFLRDGNGQAQRLVIY